MIEYKDGSFGPIGPLTELLESFPNQVELNDAVALHVGTPSELHQRKNILSVAARLKEVEERLAKVEETHITSDILHIPTIEEIKQFKSDNKSS